jgi:hypothetical protein
LGVTVIKLISAKRNARQLSLFNSEMEEKRDNVNQIIDSMKRKYGEQIIQRELRFYRSGGKCRLGSRDLTYKVSSLEFGHI